MLYYTIFLFFLIGSIHAQHGKDNIASGGPVGLSAIGSIHAQFAYKVPRYHGVKPIAKLGNYNERGFGGSKFQDGAGTDTRDARGAQFKNQHKRELETKNDHRRGAP
uniref:Secreted protein n=1 Tax=Panagrellus redivivus TaxID=6233 RepID=A0A7E4UUX1_PANRE